MYTLTINHTKRTPHAAKRNGITQRHQSPKACAIACMYEIALLGLTLADWQSARITDHAGRIVGNVAYNGTVWTADMMKRIA